MSSLYVYFVRLVVLLTCIPVHEFAHGWAAERLGDRTAAYQGRLTLNPLHHLHPIGSVLLILTGFGWANPVSVNPGNFKNPKKGMALCALAGPVSNILLAAILMVLTKICRYAMIAGAPQFLYYLYLLFSIMVQVNLGLAVFNLLPVPPLDGSRIFGSLLPSKYYFAMMRYERYVFLAMAVLLISGVLTIPLNFVENLLYQLIYYLTYFVDWIAMLLI